MNQTSASSSLEEHDREELRLLYQVSVADIAGFKQQQWAVANYALTLQAAIVAIAYQLLKAPFSGWQLWFLIFMPVALSATATFAVRHLHGSICVRRERMSRIRKLFGSAFNHAWSVPKDHDHFRWLLYVVLVMSGFFSAWLAGWRS